jgi:hypothetical protein
MIVHGHDIYRTYLAFKQHFSNPKFDFFQYDGKVKAKEETYQQRSDFWFFETLARKLTDQEVKEYMLASFVSAENPTKVWIGDIRRNGKDHWLVWQKLQSGLTYTFEQDCLRLAELMEKNKYSFNNLFETVDGHPPLLRLFIKRQVCLESIVVLDMILGFMKDWDTNLRDPLWEQLSFKIKKYKPFLSINTTKYRPIIKKVFL